jgi:adenine-specific DNA methylase
MSIQTTTPPCQLDLHFQRLTRNVKLRNSTSNSSDNSKLRGGYYTPTPVARLLAEWALQDKPTKILEPSAGDGEFVVAARTYLSPDSQVTAVELLPEEAQKITKKGGSQTVVINGDFFDWYHRNQPDKTFDAVIGNPPFIRYQNFPDSYREVAFKLMQDEGLRPSRLTNAWLPFVVLATRALRPGGRLALVLPAELLQVTYAAELREYLSKKFSHLIIVTFRQLIFPQIQQETVLLLGIREDVTHAHISWVELTEPSELDGKKLRAAEKVHTDLDHAREKWTQFYLSASELGLIREIEGSNIHVLGDVAEVDVGIVTGRNAFFVVNREEAQKHELLPWCMPLVGRSEQIPGIVIDKAAWNRRLVNGEKVYLLQLGDLSKKEMLTKARTYVEAAEQLGLHEGYKCRIRLPNWWNVPSVWAPDAFLLRQIHEGPRIVQNPDGITCTDTIHRLRAKPGVNPAWLAAASMNSLTFAFSEIRGRSYGGGVLELEPTEAEGLPFPRPGAELDVREIDSIVRGKSAETVLATLDPLILRPMGLSGSEIQVLRGVWRKMFHRRAQRKRR